jgi:hypothetical protein
MVPIQWLLELLQLVAALVEMVAALVVAVLLVQMVVRAAAARLFQALAEVGL